VLAEPALGQVTRLTVRTAGKALGVVDATAVGKGWVR
jgi:hypothetical protein